MSKLLDAAEMALDFLENRWGDGSDDAFNHWEEVVETLEKAINKKRKKLESKRAFGQNHVGCPSYPCCDLNPNGCYHQTKEVEHYGDRD